MYAMQRTSLFLDEQLINRARKLARQRGVTFAAVVREALAEYMSAETAHAEGLPAIAGRFASGESDTSGRVDELLWRDPHG